MKSLSRFLLDLLLSPLVLVAAIILKFVRKKGLHKLKISRLILLKIGVLPIRDHYYEPLFNSKHLTAPLSKERILAGINWNIGGQLTTLNSFGFEKEFSSIPDAFQNDTTFHFKNSAFASGDAEYWYNIIRLKRPKKIIEIGSGHSTKMAQLAIQQNKKSDEKYSCEHICIEPYEMPWLEKIGVEVIRKKAEEMDIGFFKRLGANDILFIDSTHIIRPQGDVLFEYLEVLPTLNPGVIVHIHDIFSPRHYPHSWVVEEIKLWNEQYLLEAFLTLNSKWKIIGALNYLHHNHFELLSEKCPRHTKDREPGSFYMVREA
jgi:Methyltransferase domain